MGVVVVMAVEKAVVTGLSLHLPQHSDLDQSPARPRCRALRRTRWPSIHLYTSYLVSPTNARAHALRRPRRSLLPPRPRTPLPPLLPPHLLPRVRSSSNLPPLTRPLQHGSPSTPTCSVLSRVGSTTSHGRSKKCSERPASRATTLPRWGKRAKQREWEREERERERRENPYRTMVSFVCVCGDS